MKANLKRVCIMLLVTVIAVSVYGVTAFAGITVDHSYVNAGSYISSFIKRLENKHAVSQTLVDYSDANMHVYSDVTVEPERVLNIWEYSPVDEIDVGYGSEQTITGHIPVANVHFAIFKVCDIDEYLDGTVELNTIPTQNEIDTYATESNKVDTIITDEDGFATYSFGYGENDGVYMIVELENAAVSNPVDPFFVSFPMINADNTGTLYTVNVYPKNDISFTLPWIDKDVTSIGNKSDTLDINEEVKWIIRGSIPSDFADALSYSIDDILDSGLTYVDGSLVVKLAQLTEQSNAEALAVLENITDYTISVTTVEGVATLSVTLTERGIETIAAAVGENYKDYEIRVYYDTVLNTTVEIGAEIENGAVVYYTNAVGRKYVVEVENKPEVHTGGLNILKVDRETNKPLAGAEFMIAREATDVEIEVGTYNTIKVADGKNGVVEKNVVYVDFFNTAEMEGSKVDTVVSDKNGVALMYGLAYGTYYLVETEAPEGYNLLAEAVPVVINSVTHLEENKVKVLNSAKFILPSTDDAGAAVLNIVALVLFGATIVIILSNRKRKS